MIKALVSLLLRVQGKCMPKGSRLYLPLATMLHRPAGAFELLHLSKSHADPAGTAIDVGANIGLFSYELRKSFARVIAFEPNQELTVSLQALGDQNIEVHAIGLSSQSGEAELHIPVLNSVQYDGWASLDKAEVQSTFKDEAQIRKLAVPLKRLDDVELPNSKISIIKVDVEGHELDFLQGAQQTLQTHRPVCVMEIRAQNRAQVNAFFRELEYRFYVAEHGRLNEIDSLTAAADSIDDFAMIPK